LAATCKSVIEEARAKSAARNTAYDCNIAAGTKAAALKAIPSKPNVTDALSPIR
jgi:hypothetical protein